ncbi:amino acid ABC transporter permease [Candidatus Babeliales bacterium]|nr:amino acid ABC transporter permease [Candidatus Babeliales bacterium]
MTWSNIAYIAQGSGITIFYTGASLFLGGILGMIFSWILSSNNSILKPIIQMYISVFRGTPLLVQLGLIYFALPALIGIKISTLAAGIGAFSLNSAAYIGEILKGGISSVNAGQIAACKTLGIPYWNMMKDIIMPQAIKNAYPSLVNEAITLLKETALISTIGEVDIMRRAHLVSAETFNYFQPLLIAAIFYYLIVLLITYFAKKFEKGISHDHN